MPKRSDIPHQLRDAHPLIGVAALLYPLTAVRVPCADTFIAVRIERSSPSQDSSHFCEKSCFFPHRWVHR